MTRRVSVVIACVLVLAAGLVVLRLRAGGGGQPAAPAVHAPKTPPPIPDPPDDLDHHDATVATLIRDAHAALVAAPQSAGAWLHYGAALHANEYYESAADVYRQTVAIDPTLARAWYFLGRVATRLGRTDEALAALAEVARRQNDFAPAFWRRGLILLEAGRADEALPLFERAVALEDAKSIGTLGIARVRLATGRVDDAITTLERYTTLETPNRGYAGHLLATAYRRAGRPDDALRVARATADAAPRWTDPWEESLATLRPGYGARIDRARALMTAGRTDKAIAELELLRRLQPDNVTVLSNLGIAYRDRARFDDSMAVLREALARDDDFFLAHFHLAVVCAQLSNSERPPRPPAALRAEAREHLDRVLALNPTYAAAHSLRGDLARLDDRLGEALRHYREARRCDPLDVRWPFRVGIALLTLGRWPEASAALRDAAAMDPNDAEIHRGLAVAAMNMGHFDEAERALAAADAVSPGDARVLVTRSQLRAMRARQGAGDKR